MWSVNQTPQLKERDGNKRTYDSRRQVAEEARRTVVKTKFG